MTEKEKAKAYDEAIERAKELYGNGITEEIFPELKESKDKKIMEAILNGLIDCRDAPDLGWSNFGGIHIDDCIDWLEKQCEQEEHKFKVGDWIITPKNKVIQITSIEDTSYCDEQCRFWTIEDGKDGDVLALSWMEDKNLWEKIIIFKKYHSEGVKGIYSRPCVEGYGNTFKNGKLAFTDEEVPYYSKTWTYTLHPATKEQRDLLFQKIKEAGYEWDSEKKELKKSVEPKFKVGDRIRHKESNKDDVYVISKVYDDAYGVVGLPWMIYMKYQDRYELVPNKFDVTTLQPFDKVLVRDANDRECTAMLFSHINAKGKVIVAGCAWEQVIPYNDDTKHLVGTKDEPLEFYRYWEE